MNNQCEENYGQLFWTEMSIFEKKYEQAIWLKIWTIILNKEMKNQFEQNYQHLKKQTSTINSNGDINNEFEQKCQQSAWTKISTVSLNKNKNHEFEQIYQ